MPKLDKPTRKARRRANSRFATSGLLRLLFSFTAMSLIAKVVATGRELVVAQQFGVSVALDCFYVAYLVPSFSTNLLTGALKNALIPTYIQVREQAGFKRAFRLLSSIEALAITAIIVVSLILAAIVPILVPYISPNLTPANRLLAEHLFWLLIPLITVSGVETIWVAALNANEHFFVTALIPVITPAVTVIGLLTAGHNPHIYWYALLLLCGSVIEVATLGVFAARRKVPILPWWYGFSKWVKQVAGQYFPMLAASVMMASTTIVDQTMATRLGPGSISLLNYGSKPLGILVSLPAMAVGTILLPRFSSLAANAKWDEVRRLYRQFFVFILAVTVPLTLGLVVLSHPLIQLLFQRGSFTAMDTLRVSRVQALLVLQMPAYVLGILAVRLIEALRGGRVFLIGDMISAAVNIVMNAVLMRFMGVAGIALSTSIVYFVSLFYLSFNVVRMLNRQRASSRAQVAASEEDL